MKLVPVCRSVYRCLTFSTAELTLFLIFLFCGGCGLASVHVVRPTIPHRVLDDGLVVEIVKITRISEPIGNDVRVGVLLKINATKPVVVGAARLSHTEKQPCTGGIAAESYKVDSGDGRLDSSFQGQHELLLFYSYSSSSDVDLFELHRPALDIMIVPADSPGDARCLRIPIVQERNRVEWEERPRWFLGGRERVLVPVKPVAGMRLVLLLALRGGLCLGDWRFGADLGFGFGGTAEKAVEDEGAPAFWLLSGGISADRFLFSAGRFGVSSELGYDLAVTVGTWDREPSDFRGVLHGPRLSLLLSFLPERLKWPGFRQGRPDSMNAALELFAALWLGDPASTPAAVLGVAIGGDWHLP